MKNKILFVVFAIFLLMNAANAFATISDSEKNNAESIINSKIVCEKLSDSQLEGLGEYYMEQMHPGNAHELMDGMMGGDDSVTLKQMHINMAKRLYCNDNLYISYGMVGSGGMMGMMNMMGGGMMGSYPANYAYSNYGYWNIFWILLFAAVIFLIVWIVYRFGIKKTASEIPLNILKKRFAKGEITKKEFDDMKKEIGD